MSMMKFLLFVLLHCLTLLAALELSGVAVMMTTIHAN